MVFIPLFFGFRLAEVLNDFWPLSVGPLNSLSVRGAIPTRIIHV